MDPQVVLGLLLLAAAVLFSVGLALILLGRRRQPRCHYCRDEGHVLRFGDATHAAQHACPVCSDGRFLAHATYPAVTSEE